MKRLSAAARGLKRLSARSPWSIDFAGAVPYVAEATQGKARQVEKAQRSQTFETISREWLTKLVPNRDIVAQLRHWLETCVFPKVGGNCDVGGN